MRQLEDGDAGRGIRTMTRALAELDDGEIKGPFVFDQIEQAPWR